MNILQKQYDHTETCYVILFYNVGGNHGITGHKNLTFENILIQHYLWCSRVNFFEK